MESIKRDTIMTIIGGLMFIMVLLLFLFILISITCAVSEIIYGTDFCIKYFVNTFQ